MLTCRFYTLSKPISPVYATAGFMNPPILCFQLTVTYLTHFCLIYFIPDIILTLFNIKIPFICYSLLISLLLHRINPTAMKFDYCPDCGARLELRQLGDEKDVPWCNHCDKPWFPVFPCAIIALVHDENDNVLLLRQEYISPVFRNLVSGYIVPGERAEETMLREIKEETGLDVESWQLRGTWWFDRKQMMMIGFTAKVRRAPLHLSVEVDDASWHTPEEAIKLVHQRPQSVSRILTQLFLDEVSGKGSPEANKNL